MEAKPPSSHVESRRHSPHSECVRRVYRATVVVGDYVAGVFILVGLMSFVFGATYGMPILVSSWFTILGSAILAGGRLARYELTDFEITRINFLGRPILVVPWGEVDGFTADGEKRDENDRFFQFTLHSRGRNIHFRDDLPQWQALKEHIEKCLVACGNITSSQVSDVTARQGRSPAQLQKQRRFVIGFIIVWITLFCVFGALSPTSVTHHEVLYRTEAGWVIRYTFKNTSVMNGITFNIEKTWLNGVPPIHDTGSLDLAHGTSGSIDLIFPTSAAKEGSQAKLHSWWQWHTGSSDGYHMQPIDVVFIARDTPLPRPNAY